MKKGHLVNAGKTNPKRTQNEPNQTQPVVSLPALSVVKGAEPISKGKT